MIRHFNEQTVFNNSEISCKIQMDYSFPGKKSCFQPREWIVAVIIVGKTMKTNVKL